MLPYKLRAPVYGSVEENKLGKTNGTDQDVLTGGGPMPKAIVSDLKAFQTNVVKHFDELHDNDGTKWGDGKAFGVFKHLFSAGKIGLLHWLIPHIKCDQEAFAQIIYAACFECFRDGSDLMERCAAVMMLYTLYETCPLIRTEDLKPEEYIPVGLQWREYPRALYRRPFRQRIRIDRTNFIQLLGLREECHIFINKAHGEEVRAPLVGVAGDTIVILERLSSHWDFCEYTGPVGLEAMAGHPDYPYRDYQEDEKPPSHSFDQGESSTAGVEETVDRQSQLKAVMAEYQNTIQAIHLGSAKTKLASDLRKTLNPVLPQEGKPSWLSRISGAESHEIVLGSRPNQDGGNSTTDRDDQVDAFESRPLAIPEHQIEHSPAHRLLVCGVEISDESQKFLEDALKVIVQRHGLSFFKKESGFQTGDGASDISTLGGLGAATVATGQGRAALDALLATADVSARIPTRVGGTSTRERHQELPNTSWDRFLYAGLLDVDNDSQEDDASYISNVSFDSSVRDEDDDNDEASAATSAIGQRALDLLLNKVSNPKTKSTKNERHPKIARRNPMTPSQDSQSQASSMGVGQAAMRLLMHQVDSRGNETTTTRLTPQNDVTLHDDGKPPARKQKRSKPQGVQPPQSRKDTRRSLEPDDQSMTSSMGEGNMALGELLKLANCPLSQNKVTSQDEANPHTAKRTRSNAQGVQPPKQPRLDARRKMELDEQSMSSSVGPGNMALGDLLKLANCPASQDDETSHDEANPPARKRTRSKAEGMPPPRPRTDPRRRVEPDEHSMASSVGAGNMALGEFLKLADKKSGNRS